MPCDSTDARSGARFDSSRGPVPSWWWRGQGGRANGRQPLRSRRPASPPFDLRAELEALADSIESLVALRSESAEEEGEGPEGLGQHLLGALPPAADMA
jgi:hypothetical protein